jgi:hypothetical protein
VGFFEGFHRNAAVASTPKRTPRTASNSGRFFRGADVSPQKRGSL